MRDIHIRPAVRSDLPRLTEIYNHYVIHTPITFDLAPHTVEARVPWLEQFATSGRHRLLVAEENDVVVGYAGTTRFRNKAAYETSVETTVYCSHDVIGHGIGSRLYAALFEAIGEDIHRIIGGYTLPNAATLALHERFGFKQVAVFSEAGRKFGRFWDVGFSERPLRL
ncbi:MAG TPA: GNAT family N-acetyltransferase [Candidatus Dormibacteraeota bacterium]|nr:GNAT family N-acetyltransferase [Candidatus Dormibacteraeota bacterium]